MQLLHYLLILSVQKRRGIMAEDKYANSALIQQKCKQY